MKPSTLSNLRVSEPFEVLDLLQTPFFVGDDLCDGINSRVNSISTEAFALPLIFEEDVKGKHMYDVYL